MKIEDTLERHATELVPHDMDGAFRYLCLAMEERFRDPSIIRPKPVFLPRPAFGNVLESRTLQELRGRRNDHYTLMMECLAIVERQDGIIGVYQNPNFEDICAYLLEHDHYDTLSCLVNQGSHVLPSSSVCKWLWKLADKHFHRLWSGEKLLFRDLVPSLDSCIHVLVRDPIDEDDVYPVSFYSHLSFVVLEYIGLCLIADRTGGEKQRLQELTRYFIHFFPKGLLLFSPMHMVLLSLHENDSLPSSYIISLIEFLLECGANINARDYLGNTPLHLGVQGYKVVSRTLDLVTTLLRAGAHPDYCNSEGQTPEDCAIHEVVKSLLRSYCSLQCLSAQLIIKGSIPCDDKLTSVAKDIVQKHRRWNSSS